MKLKYTKVLYVATSLIFTVVDSNQCLAQATSSQTVNKVRVGIMPAQDRWITLSSGQRIYNGVEVSYLLGQTLFSSSQFAPYMLDAPQTMTPKSMVMRTLSSTAPIAASSPQNSNRMEQVPLEWTKWLSSSQGSLPTSSNTPIHASTFTLLSNYSVASTSAANVDVVVTPQVEALVYASGARSNRVTYGFSPNHTNPFNAGEVGAADNQFVATPLQLAQCQRPDFFNGKFTPTGWRPTQSNFGADMDEGFVFSLFGYAIGYKVKRYTVGSQIRFLVDDLRNKTHKEFVYKVTANGSDTIMIFGLHSVSLSLEVQQAQTLTNSLKALLPQIVNQFLADNTVQSLATGATQASQTITPSVVSAPDKTLSESSVTLADSAPASTQAVQNQLTPCMDQKTNLFTSWIEFFLEIYGNWRYRRILDQPFNGQTNLTFLSPVPKIALIDSGVDYNDKNLQWNMIPDSQNPKTVFGFDFISWDNRPSDDNGHGSAAAKLLSQLAGSPFALIPLKVIGAYGQTQSGAVYDAFVYAVQNKVDAVLVPWTSNAGTTLALEEGVALAASANIPVFVEKQNFMITQLNNNSLVHIPQNSANSGYQTKALGGASVRIDAAGVAAVQNLALWLNSGGYHASH